MTPLMSLIHDTNREIQNIEYWIKNMSKWLIKNTQEIESKAKVNTSEAFVSIEYMKTVIKELKQDIDNYYIKAKEEGK